MIGKSFIPEERVAIIETWRHNCAVSCTAIFLINAFLEKKLSKKAEENLVEQFNKHYDTSLSIRDLENIFKTVFVHPVDRQIVLGPVLRDFVKEKGIEPERGNMLSDKAFEPLAKALGFNVIFYATIDRDKIGESIIPSIAPHKDAELILRIYYHGSHYDLIMDDAKSAKFHNGFRKATSPYDLPTQIGEEEELKESIRNFISDPLQKEVFDGLIAKLEMVTNTMDGEGNMSVVSEGDKLVSALRKAESNLDANDIDGFKRKSLAALEESFSVLNEHSVFKQVLENLVLFILTLGVGYLSVATYNKVTGGNFFFFYPEKEVNEDNGLSNRPTL